MHSIFCLISAVIVAIPLKILEVNLLYLQTRERRQQRASRPHRQLGGRG